MKLNHLIVIGALFGALLIPTSAQTWGVMTFGVGSGSGCMPGTYMFGTDLDYPSHPEYACKSNGTTVAGTQSGGTLDSTAFVATDKDQYVDYAITTNEFNEDIGTLYVEVYIESGTTEDVFFFEIVSAGNEETDRMILGWTYSTGQFYVLRAGGGEADTLYDASVTAETGGWVTFGVSWDVGRETMDWCISDDKTNWYGDGVDGIATMAHAPDILRMGNLYIRSNNVGYRVARWAVVSGWQGVCPW